MSTHFERGHFLGRRGLQLEVATGGLANLAMKRKKIAAASISILKKANTLKTQNSSFQSTCKTTSK